MSSLTFNTDANNDLFLNGQNNLSMVEDIQSVLKVVENAIKTQTGELQLNVEFGVPYLETVFARYADISLWESYMKDTAETIDGVVRVENMTSKVNANLLTYEMTILTTYGTGSVGV